MDKSIKTSLPDPTSATTASALSELAPASHRSSDCIAALAGHDLSILDQKLSSGSFSASLRKGQRERNLEGFLVVAGEQQQILGVINGLGKSEPGAFACRIAGASIIQAARNGRDLRSSLIAASDALGVAASKNALGADSQAGACVALAKIGPDSVTFSHLGNCRALLIRPRGNYSADLLYASTDHVLASENSSLTGPTVTRALSPLIPDIASHLDAAQSFPLITGDLVLLLSDGITQSISNQKILSLVQSELSIISVAERTPAHLRTSTVAAEICFEATWGHEAPGNQTILVYKHSGRVNA